MPNNKTIITTSKTDQDLRQILDLQSINIRTNISVEQAMKEGFVTVKHDLDLLRKMNAPFQHAIAKAGGKVVGYALVMLTDLKNEVPVLVPMFEQIDKVEMEGQPFSNKKYFIMGQVCIDKEYRGQGIFSKLFEQLATQMKHQFDYIVTEISLRNQRSIKAHQKVGFFQIDEHVDEIGERWSIVALKI